MKKYAVIGSPITHSLSPVMQNVALGESGVYTAIDVTVDDLPEFLDFARENLDGFNVTVPLKESIIPLLDDVSSLTSKSCNTVRVEEGKLIGYSTDTQGLLFGLQEAFSYQNIDQKVVAFLGCGGAVVAALETFSAHCKKVLLINRTFEKAKKLAETYTNVTPIALSSLKKEDLSEVDLLIQATSLGLKPKDALPISLDLLSNHTFIYDLIYPKTPFILAALEAGFQAVDGRDMLLGQGAKSFEIWTHHPPPVQLMKDALYEAINKKK